MPQPSKRFKLRIDQTGRTSVRHFVKSRKSREYSACFYWLAITNTLLPIVHASNTSLPPRKVVRKKLPRILSPIVFQRVCPLFLCRSHTPTWVCHVKPMKDPLGVSPSKGNQRTTPGKGKILLTSRESTHDLRIRSTVTLPTELRGRTEKTGYDLGGETRRRESKGTYVCCAA